MRDGGDEGSVGSRDGGVAVRDGWDEGSVGGRDGGGGVRRSDCEVDGSDSDGGVGRSNDRVDGALFRCPARKLSESELSVSCKNKESKFLLSELVMEIVLFECYCT